MKKTFLLLAAISSLFFSACTLGELSKEEETIEVFDDLLLELIRSELIFENVSMAPIPELYRPKNKADSAKVSKKIAERKKLVAKMKDKNTVRVVYVNDTLQVKNKAFYSYLEKRINGHSFFEKNEYGVAFKKLTYKLLKTQDTVAVINWGNLRQVKGLRYAKSVDGLAENELEMGLLHTTPVFFNEKGDLLCFFYAFFRKDGTSTNGLMFAKKELGKWKKEKFVVLM